MIGYMMDFALLHEILIPGWKLICFILLSHKIHPSWFGVFTCSLKFEATVKSWVVITAFYLLHWYWFHGFTAVGCLIEVNGVTIPLCSLNDCLFHVIPKHVITIWREHRFAILLSKQLQYLISIAFNTLYLEYHVHISLQMGHALFGWWDLQWDCRHTLQCSFPPLDFPLGRCKKFVY